MKSRGDVLKGVVGQAPPQVRVAAVAVVVVSMVSLNIGKASAACPPPTVVDGGECVLDADATLTNTLVLESGMTLDCQGHELTPLAKGKVPSGTKPMVASVPVAAVLLNDVTNAHVENCVIDDFDFGVVAMGDSNANALRNSISSNTITSLYQGVTIIEADNNDIDSNIIESRSPFSPAIVTILDSDNNVYSNNTITNRLRTGRHFFAVPIYPGGPAFAGVEGAADGIDFAPAPGVAHTVNVDGEIRTFIKDKDRLGSDNVVEDNTISFDWGQNGGAVGIFDVAHQEGLIIRNNDITGGYWSVCLDNLGISPTDFHSRDTLVENNSLKEPRFAGVRVSSTTDAVVTGNTIIGGKKGEPWGDNGILLKGIGLETATVTRNTVTGFAVPLTLQDRSGATGFDAKISLNDFVTTGQGSQNILGVDPDPGSYPYPSELSVGGKGNYWGRECDDSDGFRNADEPQQNHKVDSPLLHITDSHPYGDPVAEALVLPDPCI